MLTNDELRNYIYERFFNKTPVVEENGDPTGQDTIEPVEPMVMERDSPKQKEYTYLSSAFNSRMKGYLLNKSTSSGIMS